MEAQQINQLRAYEKWLVSRILDSYGSFLGEEKKKILSNGTLIPDNYDQKFTGPENLQGEIMRLVFKKVFEHIECTKKMNFSDGTNPNVLYGEYLMLGLVAYFSKELSQKYKILIDEPSELNGNLELVLRIKELLLNNSYPLVFNSDAVSILNVANNREFIKICDGDAVKKYIGNLNKTEIKSIDKDTGQNVNEKGRIYPLIYIKGDQYIKYMDSSEQEHIVKSVDPHIVSATYRKAQQDSVRGEEISAEEFYKTLRAHGENIPLIKESSISKSRLTASESKMLNQILSSDSPAGISGEETEHNSPDHTADDVTVADKKKTSKITAKAAAPVTTSKHPEEEPIITEEKYLQICMKTVNGQGVSEDELRQLERYDNYHLKINETDSLEKAQKDKNLSPKLEKNKPYQVPSGFAQKYLPVFIVILTILIGVIVGMAIYKIRQ